VTKKRYHHLLRLIIYYVVSLYEAGAMGRMFVEFVRFRKWCIQTLKSEKKLSKVQRCDQEWLLGETNSGPLFKDAVWLPFQSFSLRLMQNLRTTLESHI